MSDAQDTGRRGSSGASRFTTREGQRPTRDPRTGQFLPVDPAKVRRRRRDHKVVVPEVEKRVVERLAQNGVKSGHRFAVGQRARREAQAAYDSLAAELGQNASASQLMLAERIALRRAELRHWDAVLAEMRARNLLVDRKRRAFATIQMQYLSLQAELRQDLDVFARMKQTATIDQFWRELQELKAQTAARVVNNRPSPTPEDY